MEEIDPGPRSRALIPLRTMTFVELAYDINHSKDPRDGNSRLTLDQVQQLEEIFDYNQLQLMEAVDYLRTIKRVTDPKGIYTLMISLAKKEGTLTADYVMKTLDNGRKGLEAHV